MTRGGVEGGGGGGGCTRVKEFMVPVLFVISGSTSHSLNPREILLGDFTVDLHKVT